MNPGNLPKSLSELPPAVAAWTSLIFYIFIGLVLLWIVLKIIGFFYRRAYNLTPAATTGSKNLKPDFLKVDHAQRETLIAKGQQFDAAYNPPIVKATTAVQFGVIFTALVSFGSTVFFALSKIEDTDGTWQKLTAGHKFGAIVQSHPVGFVITLVIILGGLVQLIITLRKNRK